MNWGKFGNVHEYDGLPLIKGPAETCREPVPGPVNAHSENTNKQSYDGVGEFVGVSVSVGVGVGVAFKVLIFKLILLFTPL